MKTPRLDAALQMHVPDLAEFETIVLPRVAFDYIINAARNEISYAQTVSAEYALKIRSLRHELAALKSDDRLRLPKLRR